MVSSSFSRWPRMSFGRGQFAGDIEARRATGGTDLRVVLRRGAGVVVGDLDAELLLERLDGGARDDVLEFGAVAVDHQGVGRQRRYHERARERSRRSLQHPAPRQVPIRFAPLSTCPSDWPEYGGADSLVKPLDADPRCRRPAARRDLPSATAGPRRAGHRCPRRNSGNGAAALLPRHPAPAARRARSPPPCRRAGTASASPIMQS